MEQSEEQEIRDRILIAYKVSLREILEDKGSLTQLDLDYCYDLTREMEFK